MKTFLFAATALASVSGMADAAVLDLTLTNIAFEDGGTASGTLTLDTDSSIFSNVAVSVAGGTTTGLGPTSFTQALGNVGLFDTHLRSIVFNQYDRQNIITRYLQLVLTSEMSGAG